MAEITIPRGNTLEIVIAPYIDDDEAEYILQANDSVIFTVKSSHSSGVIYLQKTLTAENYNEDNELVLTLEPSDTVDLDVFTYQFDCAIRINNGERFYTFIPSSPFVVTPAFSEAIDEAGD